jgi:pyrroline-5-carboxylate reductase
MGEALLAGLLSSGKLHPGDIAVVELSEDRRAQLSESYPGLTVTASPVAASGVVIATKPAGAPDAVHLAVAAGAERVLSIAAGVRATALESAAGGSVPVVRCMPNTPAIVGLGASAISAGTHAGPADMEWAREILSAVGIVVEVPEDQLDAVTGVSGSGPAYVFLFAEALRDAGAAAGLSPELSSELAIQTLLGAATLLAEGHGTPEALRAAVTSPNGTTEAAIRTFEELDVRSMVAAAVNAAIHRSKELGA